MGATLQIPSSLVELNFQRRIGMGFYLRNLSHDQVTKPNHHPMKLLSTIWLLELPEEEDMTQQYSDVGTTNRDRKMDSKQTGMNQEYC